MNGLASLAIVAFLITAVSVFFGSEELSRQIVVLSLVVLLGYIVYETVIVRLLYFRMHLRHAREAPDSLDMQKQVWADIALVEHRVGMVLLVAILLFVGSVFGRVIGIVLAILLALVIIVRARKLKII
jgi:hypothetical protein